METEKKALAIRSIGLAVVASLGFTANAANAELGGFPLTGSNPRVAANVMQSAAVIKAETASQTAPAAPSVNGAYKVNVVTLNSGTVVREFVATSSNTVFAVAWSGPRPPNLVDILGPYSARYLKPSGSDVIHAGSLSQRSLSSQDLIVQSFGHPGRFSGNAWLPLAIPPDVSLSELQ
jgi:hypothetical protein